MRRPLDDELRACVAHVNDLRRRLPVGATSIALLEAESRLEREAPVSLRLATYGSLAPGESNHALLAPLRGRWFAGFVRGVRFVGRHGSARGFPAVRLDEGGPEVPVHVLESSALPGAWGRLDAFEGAGYRRVVVPVWDSDGFLALANVYEAVEDPP